MNVCWSFCVFEGEGFNNYSDEWKRLLSERFFLDWGQHMLWLFVQDACHYANSWMMNVCTTLFHFLVTQCVKTIMPELGCWNPDMHENLNVWWKKVGCALSFDFSMHVWVNCFICNHQTHWFWMFHESEGCHTSRGPTSEMITFFIF